MATAKDDFSPVSLTRDEWLMIVQALKTQQKVHERAAKAESDAEIADAHQRRVNRVAALVGKISNFSLLS